MTCTVFQPDTCHPNLEKEFKTHNPKPRRMPQYKEITVHSPMKIRPSQVSLLLHLSVHYNRILRVEFMSMPPFLVLASLCSAPFPTCHVHRIYPMYI